MSKFILRLKSSMPIFTANLGSPQLRVVAEEAPPPQIELRERTAAPSLINTNAQTLTYTGVILFAIAIAAAIGLVSRKRVMASILALMVALAIAALFLPRGSLRRETPPPPTSLLDKGSHQT